MVAPISAAKAESCLETQKPNVREAASMSENNDVRKILDACTDMIGRRILRCIVSLLGALALMSGGVAIAQDYPLKAVTVKVAFPAGGPADAGIRAANRVLERELGKPVVTENQAGAMGSIAAMVVMNSKPDGYTLLGTTGTDFIVAPFAISSAKYDPVRFKLLGITGISDFVLLSSKAHSFKNLDELIAYVKNPANKQLTLGHWGVGSTSHIVGADFQVRTGTSFLEVPYKGAAPVMADLVGQHVDLTFVPIGGPAVELVKSGSVKALAIASSKRNPILPEVPAFSEHSGLSDFEYGLWSGILAPPDAPEPVVIRLTEALGNWLRSSEYHERTATNGSRVVEPMTVAANDQFLKNEKEKYSRLARSLKIEPQ